MIEHTVESFQLFQKLLITEKERTNFFFVRVIDVN